MKKGLIKSYVSGITETVGGERYTRIMRYFIPEYITTLVLFALPILIDSVFVGSLKSTPTFAALGVTNNFGHFIYKIAEAFSVASVVLVGYHNGLSEYKEAGQVLRDSFWITVVSGFLVGGLVYSGAYWIFLWLGVPADIVQYGIPYIKIRAISILFQFVCLALLGFFRGIKNTRTPMYVYVLGAVTFIFFDYGLIFGNLGMPALGLNGSAWASLMQNVVMAVAAALFIFCDSRYKPYAIELFSGIADWHNIKRFFTVMWPVAIDKATLALAYLWLNKMINPMGTATVATFCAVKDMERMAFLPAVAFAQIITFLVSNDYGTQRWDAIKSNIKKVVFLSSLMVGSILIFESIYARNILTLFDKCGHFTDMAARIFPFLGILVFFDILQLILSGALRGAGNVKIVMWVRLVIIGCYFMPVSYFISQAAIENQMIKFLLIYSSFYIGNALMSVVYINRFRGERWKKELKTT